MGEQWCWAEVTGRGLVAASLAVSACISLLLVLYRRSRSASRQRALNEELLRPFSPAPPHAIPTRPEDAASLTPFRLGGLTLRNRFVRAAAFGGCTEADLTRVHESVAAGGAAMTTVAYGCVSSEGRTFAEQLLLSGPTASDTFAMLGRVVRRVHDQGAAVSLQLVHCGGFADRGVTGVQQIAPSPVFNPAGFDWPREATPGDMDRIADDFAGAARRAKQHGFDAVELHCGHGYLLSQFLSPATNTRQDKYGGSVANRLRFPLQVLEAIRRAVGPDFPVLVKHNVDDGVPNGLSLADAIEVRVVLRPGAGVRPTLNRTILSLGACFPRGPSGLLPRAHDHIYARFEMPCSCLTRHWRLPRGASVHARSRPVAPPRWS